MGSIMIETARLLGAAALVSWALAACGTKEPPLEVQEEAVAQAQLEAETGASAEVEAEVGIPRIAADEPVHDFGAIKATDSVEHVFKVKNVGTGDLKLERVQRT
jgi:predicted small lipoprotein YifL